MRILKGCITVFASVAILVASSYVLEQNMYSSPEWQSYQSYNVARSNQYDHYAVMPYDQLEEAYQSTGLTPAEIDVMRIYSLNLLPDMTSEQLSQVAAINKHYYDHSFAGFKGRFIFTLRRPLEYMKNPIFGFHVVLAIVPWLGSLIGSLKLKTRKERGWSLAYLFGIAFFSVAVMFYFVWINRYILRVVLSLWLNLACTSLFVPLFLTRDKTKNRTGYRTQSLVAVAVSVLMAGFMLGASIQGALPELKERQKVNVTYLKFLNTLDKWGYDDNILVHTPRAVGPITPGIRFFQPPLENPLITLGAWRSHSPLAREQWQKSGLDISEGYHIFANPEVRLIAAKEEDAIFIQRLLDENGLNLRYIREREWQDEDFYVEIYRFVSAAVD
ncbi:MAG TPA: hypothetical protein GX717_06165 [Clostridiaceae bacterium]|nr:hypothetical protein [Clostridiaceae bacterium]